MRRHGRQENTTLLETAASRVIRAIAFRRDAAEHIGLGQARNDSINFLNHRPARRISREHGEHPQSRAVFEIPQILERILYHDPPRDYRSARRDDARGAALPQGSRAGGDLCSLHHDRIALCRRRRIELIRDLDLGAAGRPWHHRVDVVTFPRAARCSGHRVQILHERRDCTIQSLYLGIGRLDQIVLIRRMRARAVSQAEMPGRQIQGRVGEHVSGP
jgi:hypothetical protein